MKRSRLSHLAPLKSERARAVRDGQDLEGRKKPRQRLTGPSKAVRRQVEARDGSCARCGLPGLSVWPVHSVHHRRPRGMGGSHREDINSPANLVWLCAADHAWVESHRELAVAEGFLVSQHYADPSEIPVLWHGKWVLLGHDGGVVSLDSAWIKAAHAAGGGVREIARATGLNVATVHNILHPKKRANGG